MPVSKNRLQIESEQRAEILEVARRGAKRCRDAMLNLRFSDPQHKIEMHQQLEETAKMGESLAAAALQPKLPALDSPPLSATEDDELMYLSEIERTLV